MPNWCDNYVEISHEDPVMIEKISQALKSEKFIETFIPFPDGEWNYDFCVREWGTKWEVRPEVGYQDESNIHLNFESAWSPPMGLFPVLEQLGYHVRAYYYEPGMGFVGKYEDGFDDYYEDMDDIPTELDEMFGISESREMWEEDEDA